MRHDLCPPLTALERRYFFADACYPGDSASACTSLYSILFVATARPTIAVIEADATDRHTLRSLLSALDVDVHDFESAESYLASNGEALGCVISDVTLPGMSGLDLLRLIRSMHISPPVILLGEESDVNAAVTAMREGAVDFIEKPQVDLAIVRRVAYLLDHSQVGLRH
jgi:FixJ family two-component response regulator